MNGIKTLKFMLSMKGKSPMHKIKVLKKLMKNFKGHSKADIQYLRCTIKLMNSLMTIMSVEEMESSVMSSMGGVINMTGNLSMNGTVLVQNLMSMIESFSSVDIKTIEGMMNLEGKSCLHSIEKLANMMSIISDSSVNIQQDLESMRDLVSMMIDSFIDNSVGVEYMMKMMSMVENLTVDSFKAMEFMVMMVGKSSSGIKAFEDFIEASKNMDMNVSVVLNVKSCCKFGVTIFYCFIIDCFV